MPSTVRAVVLLAEDQPRYRATLRQAVDQALPGAALIETPDDATLRAVALANPEADLVLLKLLLPGSRGFTTLAWFRNRFARMAVLIHCRSENAELMRRAMSFGAAGFVPKPAPSGRLVEAIRTVIDRGHWFPRAALSPPDVAQMRDARRRSVLAARLAALTPQQFCAIELLAQGRPHEQIAAALGIGAEAASVQLQAALQKLGARNHMRAKLRFKELEIPKTGMRLR